LERAVEDTAQKLEQGKKVKGCRKLEEMEPRMTARIADYWEWDERQEEPTDQHSDRRATQLRAARIVWANEGQGQPGASLGGLGDG
jgi:hypothetical protein